MQDGPDPNLRMLAPVAVGVFAVAFLVILLSSGVIFGGSTESSERASGGSDERQSERAERRRARRERSQGPATYTIQAGDTLGSIASENDVSVERIQELNPQLDAQTLTAGQRIRLRE